MNEPKPNPPRLTLEQRLANLTTAFDLLSSEVKSLRAALVPPAPVAPSQIDDARARNLANLAKARVRAVEVKRQRREEKERAAQAQRAATEAIKETFARADAERRRAIVDFIATEVAAGRAGMVTNVADAIGVHPREAQRLLVAMVGASQLDSLTPPEARRRGLYAGHHSRNVVYVPRAQ